MASSKQSSPLTYSRVDKAILGERLGPKMKYNTFIPLDISLELQKRLKDGPFLRFYAIIFTEKVFFYMLHCM